MADKKTVEDIERVEIAPSGDGETVDAEAEPIEESQETEESEKQLKDQLVVHKQPEALAEKFKDEPEEVNGETPRERALRLEIEHLRADKRKERANELLPQSDIISSRKELSADNQAIINKYKPEEIEALREVVPVLAEEQGYVKADQFSQTQYNERAEAELDKFLDKHPEYSIEQDKDGTLWNSLKSEFSLYAKPVNPKDYAKILNRAHSVIFNIKPAGDKGQVAAAQRKIQVASHAGASSPTRTNSSRPINNQGLRLDMLKGFSDEEKDQMLGT